MGYNTGVLEGEEIMCDDPRLKELARLAVEWNSMQIKPNHAMVQIWTLFSEECLVEWKKYTDRRDKEIDAKDVEERVFCMSCGYSGDDIQGEDADLYEGYGCPKCHSPFVVKKAKGLLKAKENG